MLAVDIFPSMIDVDSERQRQGFSWCFRCHTLLRQVQQDTAKARTLSPPSILSSTDKADDGKAETETPHNRQNGLIEPREKSL